MYQRIVAALKAGEPYYTAVGTVLRQRDYAVREPFNWRTPLLMMMLAALGAASRTVLIVVAVFLCLGTVAVMMREQRAVRWTALLAQAGVVATLATPAAIYLSEAWAGGLIGLSVIAYVLGWPALALPLGLGALFVRELAAPYCVLCTCIALYKRRWWEVASWMTGALLYGVYYGIHLARVWAHRLPTDVGHPSSWLELGGLASLTGKLQFQFWLLLAPFPLTAVALILVVAACWDRRVPPHVRFTSATYLGFFAVAGKVFDAYWGLVAWPVWSLACGFGVRYVIDTTLLCVSKDQTSAVRMNTAS